MGRVAGAPILALAFSMNALAQEPAQPPSAPPVAPTAVAEPAPRSAEEVAAAAAPAPAAPSRIITLKRDTPLELIATREISTRDMKPGDRFKLAVNKAVVVDGEKIVPYLSEVTGEILAAKASGNFGHSGKMSARLLYLTVEGVQIPMEGDVEAKGQGAGSAGLAFLTSLGSFGIGMFHRGNNAKIKAGELVAAFIAEDVMLDIGQKPWTRVEAAPGAVVKTEEPAPAAPAAAPSEAKSQ